MRVEVLTGRERRRFWSEDQKRAIVTAAFSPGTTVAEVARRLDVHNSLIYRWRKDLRAEAVPGFSEVIVSSSALPGPPSAVSSPAETAIEVMIGDARMRMTASASPDLAAAVLAVLVGR